MAAKSSIVVAIIVVCILLQSASLKRIFIKHSGSSTEGQRVKTVASNIGRLVHEFPELSGSSVEVSDEFDISSLSDLDVEEVPQASCNMRHRNYFGSSRYRCSRIIWGYNYVGKNTDVRDDYYHGTHIGGIAAATINNNAGVASVAYGVNLMIGKVLNGTGWGYYDDWMKCITKVTDTGANVINLSVGGTSYSYSLEAAVNYAVQRGVVVVVAAGNTYLNGNAPNYPGAFEASFTVANIKSDGNRNEDSTTNSFVDITAPGTYILSTVPSLYQWYGFLSGTSMATPFVAGISALMMAIKPGITADEVRSLLTTTAIDIGAPEKDDEFGYGKINPLQAAKVLLNQPPVIIVETSYNLIIGQTLSLTVYCSSVESFDSCVSLTATGELPSFMTIAQLSATTLVVSATPTVADGSSNQVTFTAVDTYGTVTTVTVTFSVPNPPQSVPITPPISDAPLSSATPSMSTSPSSVSPSSATNTPGSAVIVSSGSQLSIFGLSFLLMLCLIINN